jgi:hypothetical protein
MLISIVYTVRGHYICVMCVQRVYRGHLGRAAAASARRNKQRGVLQYSSTDNATAIVTAHALLMLQLTRQVRSVFHVFV